METPILFLLVLNNDNDSRRRQKKCQRHNDLAVTINVSPPFAALEAFSSLPSFYVIQLVQQNERIFYFCRFQQERKKMWDRIKAL